MHTENLTLYRGDTHVFTLKIMDESDSPIDLTGSSVAVLVRPKGDNPAFSPDVAINAPATALVKVGWLLNRGSRQDGNVTAVNLVEFGETYG